MFSLYEIIISLLNTLSNICCTNVATYVFSDVYEVEFFHYYIIAIEKGEKRMQNPSSPSLKKPI
jgi:hypothetical protein